MGGLIGPPIVLETKVIILEHDDSEIRERALALFAGKAQRAVGVKGDVAIFITTSEDLRRMNRQYRHKDAVTDVLSFEVVAARGRWRDVAISAEIAAANAATLGHSTETELKILILHGLLHLAGYDHETDNGEMQARETELRQQLKLPTGLIERVQGAFAPAKPHPAKKRPLAKGSRR